ncbi:hypothetical protein GGX14DRAFT_676419 [Mycena pura]|uniref:Uncharacterized protein n=1 Tax=Mycena pura TaxID=153505 RepID=A0AAD6VS16_9AGAR|nr:hypothetical protein GGX14DRAFT_676419 [Mycena pura]
MARIIIALISVVCLFQTLAAPLNRRAVTSPECSSANVAADIGILAARNSLGAINTADDIGSARLLLEAQISLLDANNGTTQIADSLLDGAAPAPADSQALIVSGLLAAQGALNKVFSFENATTEAVKAANSSITTALGSRQSTASAASISADAAPLNITLGVRRRRAVAREASQNIYLHFGWSRYRISKRKVIQTN